MNFEPDYYKRLGISENAPEEVIKASYRALAKKYHPDVNSSADASETFKKLTDAFDCLSDSKRRHDYDSYLMKHKFENGEFAKSDGPLFYSQEVKVKKSPWRVFLSVLWFIIVTIVNTPIYLMRLVVKLIKYLLLWIVFFLVWSFIVMGLSSIVYYRNFSLLDLPKGSFVSNVANVIYVVVAAILGIYFIYLAIRETFIIENSPNIEGNKK
ncbi:J domain-containing protein [Lactovum miscens]|nr:DnaJ domain-containing protein [Lactovum miscens]